MPSILSFSISALPFSTDAALLEQTCTVLLLFYSGLLSGVTVNDGVFKTQNYSLCI